MSDTKKAIAKKNQTALMILGEQVLIEAESTINWYGSKVKVASTPRMNLSTAKEIVRSYRNILEDQYTTSREPE